MDSLKKRFQVSRWIASQFAGMLSEAERAELESWRNESVEHEQEYQELLGELKIENLAASSQRLEGQWERFQKLHVRSHRLVYSWWRYAAVVIVLLGVATLMRWQWRTEKSEVVPVSQTIRMSEGEVTLILSTGEKLVLGNQEQLVKRENNAKIRVENQAIHYEGEETEQIRETWNTLIIPKGGEYELLLIDGSRVWLNAETELRYPVHFTGETRKVFLKGEAYFEVARNTHKPFIVATSSDVEVKVLGTKFNVASYEDEPEIVTTLTEGCVEVGNTDQVVRMQPDQQVVIRKDTRIFSTRKVDANVYSAWKDGKFIFEEQTLEQIMKKLQRWYEMDVFYANEEVRNFRFSGDLKKYEDFSQIIKMIEEVANLKITIQDKCVVVGAK